MPGWGISFLWQLWRKEVRAVVRPVFGYWFYVEWGRLGRLVSIEGYLAQERWRRWQRVQSWAIGLLVIGYWFYVEWGRLGRLVSTEGYLAQ